ncbi:MAG: asparagine synthetase B, partial [bacterium]|nr:asparagine synthetase B [bacterium]
WYSMESRVPFLDHRLVERTLALPPDKIVKNGYTKHILREAMKNTLPGKIRLRQDKIGFLTPWEKWLKKDIFKTYIFDILGSTSFKQRGILDAGKCLQGYKQFTRNKKNIPKEAWKWLNLEIWYRTFIENNEKLHYHPST